MMKIIFDDAGTAVDLTANLNRYQTGTSSFTFETGDTLYIGTDVPFNHTYIKMGTTVNLNSSVITLQYWDGKEFVNTVETIDETNGFAQNGYITFVPNKDNRWSREDTDDLDALNTLLGNTVIYDKYWLKMTVNVTTTADLDFDWMGQIFSDDFDLESEFPDLTRTNVKTAFKSGKTDWQEQAVIAAGVIASDLKERQIIEHDGQILRREQLRLASVQKTAEIIMSAFGADYDDDRRKAREEYKSRLKTGIFTVDKDNDGIVDLNEQALRTGFMKR